MRDPRGPIAALTRTLKRTLTRTLTRRLFLTAAFAGLVPALVSTAAAQATETQAEVKSSTELLPPGVLLHARFTDVNEYRERLRNSPTYGLFTDESLADFRSQVVEKIDEVSEELQENTGLTLEDIFGMAEGEVAFALMQPPGESISAALFVDYGENQDTVDTILELLEAAAIDEGGEILSEDVDGTDLVTIIMSEEPGVPPEIASYNYMLRDNVWVMASTLEALQNINDRWDGGGLPTFAADDATYQEVQDQLDLGTGRDPITTLYVNPVGILRSGITAFAQANPQGQQAMMALGFFPVIGLDNLKAIGSAGDIDPDTGGNVGRTFIRFDRNGAPGVFDLFSLAAADNTPPDFVAADATAYQSLQWQADKAYKAVSSLADQFAGPGFIDRQLDQVAEMPDGPGIHPKEDVLDQITGRLVAQNDLAGRGEQAMQRTLISLELTKDSTLPETIERLVSKEGGEEVEKRDFRGTTVYQFEMPSQNPADPNGTQTGGLAVAGGYLHLTTEIGLLEAALRGIEDKLSGDERFLTKTQDVPKETLFLQYADGASQFEQVYELARSGTFDEATEDLELDFTELPPFKEIKKYFGKTVSYGTRLDNGVLIKTRSDFED